MDPLQFAALGKFPQVAPDRVFRRAQLVRQIFSYDLALGSQATQDQFLTLRSEHGAGDGNRTHTDAPSKPIKYGIS
jgi:hypothetical protein